MYFGVAFLLALISTKNIVVSILAIPAIIIQFFGYGYGFLKSTIAVSVLNKDPENHFPKLFFKSK
ncbi:glycosyltransferase [Algibacter lectus]|uniref:Glycosyltransferase n=1 Tax=Algibacter lectus TaxID=221126 RepID=A0A090WXI9_9FLAO|nr:glycosyltransferase [Algibacter lectus]